MSSLSTVKPSLYSPSPLQWRRRPVDLRLKWHRSAAAVRDAWTFPCGRARTPSLPAFPAAHRQTYVRRFLRTVPPLQGRTCRAARPEVTVELRVPCLTARLPLRVFA